MAMIEITLPDEVAQGARRAGLLSDSAIQQLLEDALRRRVGRALLDVSRDIEKAGTPPMTLEEINAEVKADRAERRSIEAAAGIRIVTPAQAIESIGS